MYARCPRCRAVLQVPALAAADKTSSADAAGSFCLACGDPLDNSAPTASCEQCGAIYHPDCWQERGRCLAPQCPSRQRWRLPSSGDADRALCSSCGEPLPAGSGQCARCAQALARLAQQSAPPRQKPRTSYSAGFALIAAGCAVIFFMVMPPGQLAFWAAAIAAAALGLGIYALRRIRASAEPIRGLWAASVAVGLAALALLKFVIDLIAAF
ncbi:MAG: hypothetical protein N3A66_05775 [Planctomycetota bacterium]|nr:hypothetical protein [Planctomycetota bacterium]